MATVTIKRWDTGAVIAEGPTIREALTAAVKSGANLSGANLTRADLSGANLTRADLSRANLTRADLSRASLMGANLSEADLSEANLSRANLSGASLMGANLSGANLAGTNGIIAACRSEASNWFVLARRKGGIMITAGCRYFETFDAARAHWTTTRGGTQHGEECLAIVDHLERMAKIAGWIK